MDDVRYRREMLGPVEVWGLDRFDPNWIAVGPPLTITAEQIDDIVAILDRSLGSTLAEVA